MIVFDPPSLEQKCKKEVLLSTIKEEAKLRNPDADCDMTIVAVMQIDLSHIAFRKIPTWARGEEDLPYSLAELGDFHGTIAKQSDCIDHIAKDGVYHAFWYVAGVADVA